MVDAGTSGGPWVGLMSSFTLLSFHGGVASVMPFLSAGWVLPTACGGAVRPQAAWTPPWASGTLLRAGLGVLHSELLELTPVVSWGAPEILNITAAGLALVWRAGPCRLARAAAGLPVVSWAWMLGFQTWRPTFF